MGRRGEVRCARLLPPLVVVLLLVSPPTYAQRDSASEEPCSPEQHQVIRQVERSFNYRLPEGEQPLCDRLLAEGWYRFSSGAGGNMPTACPGAGFCGTQSPIWLKGSIPGPAEGTVARTACINQGADCCVGQVSIQVRNCSDFTVYRLPPSPGCSLAYCAGHEVSCPPGLTSRTGFTPCYFTNKVSSASVRLTTDALEQEILFMCEVALEERTTPGAFVVEVSWRVDGRLVDTEQFTPSQRRAGVLRENQWKMGQTISCSARLRHELVAKYGPAADSEPFFAGIRVLSQSPLRLKEGSSARYIQLVATVPVLCARAERGAGAECCTYLELGMRVNSDAQRCANGDLVDRVGLPNCLQQICSDNWNLTQSVPVRARLDHLLDDGQTLTVDMRTQFSAHRQWSNYQLPPQTVEVIGDDVVEVCVVDMFMYTFDSFAYQHRRNGTFILYQHDTLPHQVQVRFGPCSRRELCVCSVAVHVGEVIIAADICSRGYLRTWRLAGSGGRTGDAPPGLRLQQLNDGRSYQIEFPGGTRLVLGPYLGYVKVYASPVDLRQTRGLCGSFDRDQSNDLARRDGSIACRQAPYGECAALADAWRVEDARSLFAGVIPPSSLVLPPDAGQPYCACEYKEEVLQAAQTERPLVNGLLPAGFRGGPARLARQTARGQLPPTGEVVCTSSACKDARGKDYVKTLFDDNKDIAYDAASSTLTTAAELPRAEYGPLGGFATPAPPGGWSRQTALQFCRSYLQGTPLVEHCRGVRGARVDDKLAECAADILYTGGTRWAVATLDSFKEDCRTEIYRNTSLWTQEGESTFPSPPQSISALLCLNDCSGHGRCDKGLCLCERGFVGSDCSIDLTAGPRVAALQDQGLCDVTRRPCRSVVIQGENFADNGDLVCHFEIYNLDGTLSSPANVVQTEARFLSFQQLVCQLPDLVIHDPSQPLTRKDRGDASRAVMEVSVCYGSGPRSRPQQLLVYDGRCWQCAPGGSCTTRPRSPCFLPGQLLPVVPVLRFHFNFSGVDVHVGGRHPTCALPRDPGPCLGTERRYYFDFGADTCKAFNYGGCLGNSNNFRTLGQCGARCGKLRSASDRTDLTVKPPLCFLPPNSGPCQKVLTRHFFDPASGGCSEFSYGGCFGNANNFETKEECRSVCGSGTAVVPPALVPTPVSAVSADGSVCRLPVSEGKSCLFRPESRFAYNQAQARCERYKYQGCGGNSNSFSTLADCRAVCGPRAASASSPSPFSPVLDCALPQQRGPCAGSVPVFHWDSDVSRCRIFTYSGCGGNANNFATEERCRAACGRAARLTLPEGRAQGAEGRAAQLTLPERHAEGASTEASSEGRVETTPAATETAGRPAPATTAGTEVTDPRPPGPAHAEDAVTDRVQVMTSEVSPATASVTGTEHLTTAARPTVDPGTVRALANDVETFSVLPPGGTARPAEVETFAVTSRTVTADTNPTLRSAQEATTDRAPPQRSRVAVSTQRPRRQPELVAAPARRRLVRGPVTRLPGGRSRIVVRLATPQPRRARQRAGFRPTATSRAAVQQTVAPSVPTPPTVAPSVPTPPSVVPSVPTPPTVARARTTEAIQRVLSSRPRQPPRQQAAVSQSEQLARPRQAAVSQSEQLARLVRPAAQRTVARRPRVKGDSPAAETRPRFPLSTERPPGAQQTPLLRHPRPVSSSAAEQRFIPTSSPAAVRVRTTSQRREPLSSPSRPAVAPPRRPPTSPDALQSILSPWLTSPVAARTVATPVAPSGAQRLLSPTAPRAPPRSPDLGRTEPRRTRVSSQRVTLQGQTPLREVPAPDLSSAGPRSLREGRTEPTPLRQGRPEPAPLRQGRTEPAPLRQGRTKPAPLRQERTEPAPLRQDRTEPAPLRQGRTEPAPLRQERTKPAPLRQERTKPAPLRERRPEPPALRDPLTQVCQHPPLDPAQRGCPVGVKQIERFYYDQATGNCETFLYAGCGATLNHFNTRSECERSCRPLNMCFRPMPRRGATCADGETVSKFFFNAETSVCESVDYQECDDDEELANSFSDIESCILTCEAPSFLSIRL